MRGKMTDMAEVKEEMTFEALPEGTYTFVVTERADKESKNGDPMVQITLEVEHGTNKGRKVWDNILLSTNPDSPGYKVRWRAKMFLKAIGEEYKGDNFSWDSDRWAWRKCIGEVKHEIQKEGKYKGQPKAVIVKYTPLEVVAKEVENDPQVPF